MSLVMLCFPCCVEDQPPPRRRPRIDRTQIGLPTNFQHTGHIGSGEVASGFDVHQVQTSMQSKGGYEHACSDVTNTPTGIDLTPRSDVVSNGTPLAVVGKTSPTTENSDKNIPMSTSNDEAGQREAVNGTALTCADAEDIAEAEEKESSVTLPSTVPSDVAPPSVAVSTDQVDVDVAVNGNDDEIIRH